MLIVQVSTLPEFHNSEAPLHESIHVKKFISRCPMVSLTPSQSPITGYRPRDSDASAQLQSSNATDALQLGWQRSHDQHSA